MADLDVQPKKKGSSKLPWILLALGVLALIIFLARGCNDKREDNADAALRTDTGAANSGIAAPAANAANSGGAAASGWWDNVDRNLPVTRFDEITNKDVEVRGNDKYSIYGVDEEILFDKGKSTLKPGAEEKLRQVASSIAKRYKNGNVRIYGYTDSVGSAQDNKALAEKRTEAVKTWLTNAGNMPSANITQHPIGETNPQATNATEAGRKQNRRVEIVAAVGGQ